MVVLLIIVQKFVSHIMMIHIVMKIVSQVSATLMEGTAMKMLVTQDVLKS